MTHLSPITKLSRNPSWGADSLAPYIPKIVICSVADNWTSVVGFLYRSICLPSGPRLAPEESFRLRPRPPALLSHLIKSTDSGSFSPCTQKGFDMAAEEHENTSSAAPAARR